MDLLLEINTRLLMSDLAKGLGRPGTLNDVSTKFLNNIKRQGFDSIWFLGVWQTGDRGREIARTDTGLRKEYLKALPDFTDADVCGSCFAVQAYDVHKDFGGNKALVLLYSRMKQCGLKLILDFVPNHVATDHKWVTEHPEYFVKNADGTIAHGKDPNYDGWTDTYQLNYAGATCQVPGSKFQVPSLMLAELLRIAEMCDGVRCDMAMLILPEVFERTWGIHIEPFWPNAIASVKNIKPEFVFIAEVYWDLEWRMMQDGFDFAYDKRLYDRLRNGGDVKGHLSADVSYLKKLVHFLENHDEERAASVFPLEKHKAAAITTFLIPGLRLIHNGQLEGKRIKTPIQLSRSAEEEVNIELREFYGSLLETIKHNRENGVDPSSYLPPH